MNRETQKKQSNENTTENNENILEDKVSYHQLSKPTVGRKHSWIQRGTFICCDTCETPHGFSVRPGTLMIGMDDNGMPKFK